MNPTYYPNTTKSIKMRKIHLSKQKSYKSNSIATGNQALGSKKFFQFATNRKNTTIEILSDPQGKLTSKKEELLEATHNSYKELYNKRPTDPLAMQHFLQHIKHRSFTTGVSILQQGQW